MKNRKSLSLNHKSLIGGLAVFLIMLILGIFITVRNEVPFPNAKIIGDKNYPAFAAVSFTVKLNDPSADSGQANNFSLIRKALAVNDKKVGAAILYGKNQKSDAKVEMVQKDSDTYVITAKNNKFFKAGKYTLAVTLSDLGNSRVLTQDFTWGVLALNTNKSIYNVNEKVKLFYSVLTEKGFNDCYAKLELNITSPDGKTEIQSSQNGKIKRTKDCQGDNVTYEPDYFSDFQTSTAGKYQMNLKAVTKNGTYEIKDYFEVKVNQDFEVERITATRINPVSPYTVKIKIKANKDFQGKIIENLPYAFGAKGENAKVSFDKEKYTHTISWEQEIKKGEVKELSYEFKAPEKSPEFYLLGPLQMIQKQTIPVITSEHLVFQEARYWQIAADPTNLILLWDPANGATPSGWTCISCSTGDPFFQSFIRGNSTYGGTGGTSTETPSVATFTISAESLDETTAKAGANAASGSTHTHTASNPTIGSANIIPTFKSLMVIRYDSGIPTGASAIPQNAIAFFDATVPTGWTRYSAQDGNYVRGDWTGTTGGSNTQTHTITWQSLAAASTAEDVIVANGGSSAISAHTHTTPSQTSTASINIEPPYIQTILGKANANTTIPNAIIGMFDGAPGTGWTLKSNTGGDPFFQVFPKPSAAYGTTGGTTTHNHASETSGVSGAPSATTTNGAGTLTVAADTHTHTENVTFSTGSTNVPPFTDAIFAQKAFTVTGTVRQSNESTAIGNPPCDSSTGVIDIRINGGAATTISCSSVDSTYSATPGTVVAGDVITILLNGSSTPKANTIIRAGASDATSADLYQNVVVARSDDVSAITNANICTFTTSMLFSCSTNNITVNSNVEFHVSSGTYTQGATLTTQGTGNLHIASGAIANLDTATNTIANNIVIDTTATLNINANTNVNGGNITVTGTLNTTAGTPTVTISGTGSISGGGNATFYALTTSGTGTTTYSASGTNTVNNNLTVGAGTTLNINSSITVTGNLTNTTTGIIGTTAGTPTVTVNGSAVGGGSGTITFYNLTTGGTTTFSGAGTNTINNNLIVNAGSLTLSNTLTVTGTGNVNTGATLNINANLNINGGALTTTTTGIINTTAGTPTLTMSGTGTLGGGSGAITLYNLATSGTGTTTFTNGGTNTVNNDITVGSGTTLNINSSVSIGNSLTNTTSGVIGTSAGTPTVTVSGSTIGGGTTGAITFYNLTKAGAGTTTFSNGGTNTINNNLSVSAGTFVQSSTLTVTGDGSVSTGAALTIGATLNINGGALTTTTTGTIGISGTPTLTMSGTGTLGGGSGAITLYNLATSGTGTTTFSGSGTNIINNNVSVGAGTTLNINSSITVTGNLTNTTTGIIGTTAGTPTVTVNGSTIGGGTTGTITFYNLTIGIAGSATFSNGGTNTINNNLAVNAGTTLNINSSVSIAGSLTNTTSGVIGTSAGTPTVTMTGTGSIGGGTTGAITFYNLSTSGTGTTTFTNGGTNTVNNDITVGSGTTLNINSSITVAGNFNNTTTGIIGTTAGTPTVTVNGSTIGGGTTGAITFYNLTKAGAGTTTFSNGGTNTVNNNLSVGAGTTLNINSSVSIGNSLTNTTSGVIGTSAGTPTVTMTGTGSIGGGTTGAITFYNLSTSGTGTTTFTNGGTNTVNNDITVGSGTTLNINSSITVAGNFNNTTTGIIGTTAGTPTVTVSGSTIGGGTTGTITFYNLTKAGAGTTTFSNGGTNTVNNNLSISSGTFIQSNTLAVTGDVSVSTGATFNTNANLTITGGDLTTAGTGVVNTTAGTGVVTINGTGGNIGGGGTVTVYNLTLGGSGTQTLQSGTTANNDVSVGTGKTLSLNNLNLTVSGGDLLTTSTGSISCSGTTGTVTVNGTATTGIGGGSGTITFCNLTIGGTVPIATDITVNNVMNNNGTTSGSVNVTVNGNVAGTGNINMSSGTFKQRVATSSNFGTTSGAGTWSFSALTLSNSSGSPITITTQSGGSGTITTSTLNIGEGGDSSTTALNAGNRTWAISGTGTPITINGSSSINTSTSTFSYTGSGSVNLGNFSYYSLATNGSGTYSPSASPIVATNNVAVSSGTLSLGTNDLNVGSSSVTNSGGISVSGTLSQSASATTTIVSSSAGTATIGGAGTITFYNLSFLPAVASAPTFTLGSAASQTITINNDLTVGNGSNGAIVTANSNNPIIDINGSLSIAISGTFTAPPSSSFTIAKNMTNNGTFNANGGNVTFDTTNSSTFAGSGNPAITFNDFTSIIPTKSLIFTATEVFRVNGAFNVAGAAGQRINIQSTSGTQWKINSQGTSSVTYASIINSGCEAGTLNVNVDGTSIDNGNNDTCWVFAPSIVSSRVAGSARISGSVRIK